MSKNAKNIKHKFTIKAIKQAFANTTLGDKKQCICDKNDEDELSSRTRTQRIFRSIQKPFRKKKTHECNNKIGAVDLKTQIAFTESQQQQDEESNMDRAPKPPPRRLITKDFMLDDNDNSQYLHAHELNQEMALDKSLGREHFDLARYGWFWGPMTKQEAEKRLTGEPDGAFLIRDSSSERHVFSLSFRSYGKTMHTHIDYNRGIYSMGEQFCHRSVSDVIESAIKFSEGNVFSYSKSRNPAEPAYPVRLTKPVSRFTHVRTLQYLSRFLIRQYINVNDIQKLPLPISLKEYLKQGQY